MTNHEKDNEVGATVREFSELQKTAACLKRRLERFYKDLEVVIENPYRADELDKVTEASDPREDARALADTRKKIAECENFLRKQGLSNIIG